MSAPRFVRQPANPIVRPGGYDWRLAVTYIPNVVFPTACILREGTLRLY